MPVNPKEEADSKLWQALAAASLAFLLVGSFWFQHWYVLWLLAPAVLNPRRSLTRFMVPWICFGALCANVTMDFLSQNQLNGLSRSGVSIIALAVIWGPLAVACLIHAVKKNNIFMNSAN